MLDAESAVVLLKGIKPLAAILDKSEAGDASLFREKHRPRLG
jgi:hypothetical protein